MGVRLIAAAVIDCFDRARFFERFSSKSGIDIKYVLSEHSYLLRDLNREKVKAGFVSKIAHFFDASHGQYSCSLDFFLNGALKAKCAFAKGVADTLLLLDSQDVDLILIWNGCQAYARGVSHACDKIGISKCFLEIGNFPGKLFVDPKGVNAESLLYQHLNDSQISGFRSKNSGPSETAEEIISHITQRSVPPQKDVIRKTPTVLERLCSDPFSSVVGLIGRRASVKIFDRFEGIEWNQEVPDDYIFVALQVSTDTQMLLNSDVNSEAMLADLQEKYRGHKLVVKFHPCDSVDSINHLRKIIFKNSNITINQSATVQLIQGAQKVVTINSTVGLEAILMGKDVEFYGRSLFASLSQDDAVFYLNYCLANIDYFSSEPITLDQAREIESYLRCTS